LGYWEPTFLVDVTRTPFCLVNLGGIELDLGSHWTEGMVNTVMPMNQTSFYQVHWYIFPLMHWLNLLGDLACQEESDFDLAYLTELDPLWNDEELALILNPEALLFANTTAQLACGADVIAASSGHLPIDSLFWCAGAQGSYYPLTGFVREHHGAVHASTLLAERMNFKLHRELLAWDSSPGSLCAVKPYAIMPKSRYRYQMSFPVPATKYPNGAQPFGHTTLTWEAGHSYPGKGEHFGYLIWRKRNCCGL